MTTAEIRKNLCNDEICGKIKAVMQLTGHKWITSNGTNGIPTNDEIKETVSMLIDEIKQSPQFIQGKNSYGTCGGIRIECFDSRYWSLDFEISFAICKGE